MGLLKGTEAKQPAQADKSSLAADWGAGKPNFTVRDGINLGVGLGIAWAIVLPILLSIAACTIWTFLMLVGASVQSLFN